MSVQRIRLTQYAHGGGCACKIPPGELEAVLGGLMGPDRVRNPTAELLVGLDHGDDAAVVRISGAQAVISTADFFTPVVDDAYDWGRIAAANALSDVYAMGGVPIVAINLLGWPRDVLPLELAVFQVCFMHHLGNLHESFVRDAETLHECLERAIVAVM